MIEHATQREARARILFTRHVSCEHIVVAGVLLHTRNQTYICSTLAMGLSSSWLRAWVRLSAALMPLAVIASFGGSRAWPAAFMTATSMRKIPGGSILIGGAGFEGCHRGHNGRHPTRHTTKTTAHTADSGTAVTGAVSDAAAGCPLPPKDVTFSSPIAAFREMRAAPELPTGPSRYDKIGLETGGIWRTKRYGFVPCTVSWCCSCRVSSGLCSVIVNNCDIRMCHLLAGEYCCTACRVERVVYAMLYISINNT